MESPRRHVHRVWQEAGPCREGHSGNGESERRVGKELSLKYIRCTEEALEKVRRDTEGEGKAERQGGARARLNRCGKV